MADATDLKSVGPKGPCGFESRHRQMRGSRFAEELERRAARKAALFNFKENGSQTSSGSRSSLPYQSGARSKICGLRIRANPAILTIEGRDPGKIIDI
jgi:hypothetical protein